MATIKHIASKNANYGGAERYLIFKHDEITNKPILDNNGHYIPRNNYIINSINCDVDTFAVECMEINIKYGKNTDKNKIKSHHYIISFDPRDSTKNALTMEKAQKMGMKFTKENFPGYQALVCTHLDGHNHSGNIHVHIVFNSVRTFDVERKPYMDRKCDNLAGSKHRCTGKLLRYLRESVMEMCKREKLYQIDLLSGSKNRIANREYYAQKSGQKRLNKENALLMKQGEIPKVTKFDTYKEELRQAITVVLLGAKNTQEFKDKMLQNYGVVITESRGRWSYIHPNRTKPISDRKLGDNFRKEVIENGITELKNRTIYYRNFRTKQQDDTRTNELVYKPKRVRDGECSSQTIVDRVRESIGDVEARTKQLYKNSKQTNRQDGGGFTGCEESQQQRKGRDAKKYISHVR